MDSVEVTLGKIRFRRYDRPSWLKVVETRPEAATAICIENKETKLHRQTKN